MEEQVMQCEASDGDMPKRRPAMTMARKKELFALAEQIAVLVKDKTQPHEGCFLRQAVEMLVDR